jgi:hypothetical protein
MAREQVGPLQLTAARQAVAGGFSLRRPATRTRPRTGADRPAPDSPQNPDAPATLLESPAACRQCGKVEPAGQRARGSNRGFHLKRGKFCCNINRVDKTPLRQYTVLPCSPLLGRSNKINVLSGRVQLLVHVRSPELTGLTVFFPWVSTGQPTDACLGCIGREAILRQPALGRRHCRLRRCARPEYPSRRTDAYAAKYSHSRLHCRAHEQIVTVRGDGASVRNLPPSRPADGALTRGRAVPVPPGRPSARSARNERH